METEKMKQCPYCAEMVKAEAIKCRYCGSSLEKAAPGRYSADHIYWRRVREGKKVAGVCTGLSRQFDLPILVLPLRVAFLATTFLWFFGPILYILLWILMPAPESEFESGTANSAPYAGGPDVSPGSAGSAEGGTA